MTMFNFVCSAALNFQIEGSKKTISRNSKENGRCSLGSCCEFGRRDDANAWRKSTKEADNTQNFYGNLESKNLSMHWRHHGTNSRQRSSVRLIRLICRQYLFFQLNKGR